jgi:hypothetical protein
MLIWIVGIVSSLGLVGAIVAVILVPGIAIPVLQRIVSAVLTCKPCLAVLAGVALLFAGSLYGVHVERARGEARIERMRQAAIAAAGERDAEVKADLEKTYAPQLATLRQQTSELQQKVKDYEKPIPAAKPATAAKPRLSCKLGDAAGLLRPAPVAR